MSATTTKPAVSTSDYYKALQDDEDEDEDEYDERAPTPPPASPPLAMKKVVGEDTPQLLQSPRSASNFMSHTIITAADAAATDDTPKEENDADDDVEKGEEEEPPPFQPFLDKEGEDEEGVKKEEKEEGTPSAPPNVDTINKSEEKKQDVVKQAPPSKEEEEQQQQELDDIELAVAAEYRRLLRVGVPETVVRHRMRLDRVDQNPALVAAVFSMASDKKPIKEEEEEEDDLDYYTSRIVRFEDNRNRDLLPFEPPPTSTTTAAPARDVEEQPSTHPSVQPVVDSKASKGKGDEGPQKGKQSAEEEKEEEESKTEDPHESVTIHRSNYPVPVELLSAERAARVTVALQAFPELSQDELVDSIACLERIHGHRYRLLRELLPATPAEHDAIVKYSGISDDTDLSLASQWMRRIVLVPNYESKVKVIQTMENFSAVADYLSQHYQLLDRVSDQILDSKKLKGLLACILRVATVLDIGSDDDDDDDDSMPLKSKNGGYNVEKLSKLARTETVNNGMTVMDFVVRGIAKSHSSLDLMADFPECEFASRLDAVDLFSDRTRLHRAIEICQTELSDMKLLEQSTARWAEAAIPLEQSIQRLSRFLAYATVRISQLDLEHDLAYGACFKLTKFCGRQGVDHVQDCLKSILAFTRDADQAWDKYVEETNAGKSESDMYLVKWKTTSISEETADTTKDEASERNSGQTGLEPEAASAPIADTTTTYDRTIEVIQEETVTVNKEEEKDDDNEVIDTAHIRDVKSLAELYSNHVNATSEYSKSKWHDVVEKVALQNNEDEVPDKQQKEALLAEEPPQKDETKSATQRWAVVEEHLHHVHSLVNIFSEIAKPNTGASYNDANQKEAPETNRATQRESITDEHLHHVDSVVEVFSGLPVGSRDSDFQETMKSRVAKTLEENRTEDADEQPHPTLSAPEEHYHRSNTPPKEV